MFNPFTRTDCYGSTVFDYVVNGCWLEWDWDHKRFFVKAMPGGNGKTRIPMSSLFWVTPFDRV